MTGDLPPFHPRRHAIERPDDMAFRISTSREAVSFAQLEARANQAAHGFRQLGLKRGDHIVVLMENRREFLEICFAADRSGLYYTTASTHLTNEEIHYIINDCHASLVLVSDTLIDRIRSFSGLLPGDCRVMAVGSCEGILPSFSGMVAAAPVTPIGDESQGLDMLYSSGTTGRPKGVKWALPDQPVGSPSMLIELLSGLFGYGAGTRYLCPAPLYHAAPLRHTMVTIRTGGSAIIMPKFDAETSLALIEAERITHSQWVPTMFVRLLKLPEEARQRHSLVSMRMAVHAAAPCPVDIKRQMIEWWGPIIHEYYAGTENNGFTALTTEEWLDHVGSVGRAKLGVIHICDERGAELPVGAEGEVFFENGHQFEYHNDPVKTASSRNARGWTTLGDIGRLDEDGYLYLTDRKSFVIISGGVNIYPQEIENLLLQHEAVLDAAVIGIPNEEFGEEVKAVVQLADGHEPNENLASELVAFCRARIAAFKCPRTIDFRAEFPRSPTGKLLKRQIRDEYRSAGASSYPAGHGRSSREGRLKSGQDLSGQDLSGQDLSGQDLQAISGE